ncbi:MAG: O-antigen ligase family protein [Actinomycetota bacterium]|nr:O-antigen ligase family protein [Actinomycetota bacterium]
MTRTETASRSPEATSPALAKELRKSRLRLLGVAALCAKVALVPLIFDPSLDMPFVVSKGVVSHGLACVLAATMAGLFVQFGRAFVVRSWLHVPVLAFLLTSMASTLFAVNLTLALFGTHARMLGLASTVDFVVLYLAIVMLVRTRHEAFAVAIAALAVAFPVLGYELVQMLGRDPFSWSNADVNRPFSTLGEATALAQYLMTLALGTFALGLLAERLGPALRALVLTYALFLLAGAVFTGTRSALLGLAAGGVLLIVMTWRAYPSQRARTITIVGSAATAGALIAILLLSPQGARIAATLKSPTVEDEDISSSVDPSVATRLALYRIGVDMVRERPILGYGPDNFTAGLPQYRPERADVEVRQSLPTSAHSWVFQVATSSGLVGLGCFLAITIVGLGLAFKGVVRSTASVGAVMLAAFLATGLTTVNEFGTEWLFWASASVIATSTSWRRSDVGSADPSVVRPKRRRVANASHVKRLVPMPLVAVAVLAALMGANALDASRLARSSQESRLVGQSTKAIELGLGATRSDSERAEYWHELGLAYVSVGRWSQAIPAFDRASGLAKYNARYVGDLATAYLLLSQTGGDSARNRARELGEQAVRIDPNNPLSHLTRAVVMHELGDLPEALRSIERALDLDPNSLNERLFITATKVFLDSGRASEAVRVARQGLVLLGGTKASLGIRLDLARALVASGQPREAVMELDVALLIQPNDPTAEQLRAEIIASILK